MDMYLFSTLLAVVFLLLLKQQFEFNTTLFLLKQMTRRQRREEEQQHLNNALLLRCVSVLPLPPSSKTRGQWMKVRSKDWWERIVLQEFTDYDWKENFRMTRQTFVKLCGLVEDFMAPEDFTVRAPIPLMMRVAMVVYRMGTSGEYRIVANQFGVHKCTVMKFTVMFCEGMVKGPIKDLIHMPNEEEATEIARRFEAAYGVPQIMGIIDGTHIPILPPIDGYKDFVNRKGWASYVLQAVVDDACW